MRNQLQNGLNYIKTHTCPGKRSNLDIIADILRLGEAGKTEIIDTTRITHSQLKRYLTRLLILNLIEKQHSVYRRDTYRVTEKGQKLLDTLNGIRQMLQPKLPVNMSQSFKL